MPGDCCCDWQNCFPPKADGGAEEKKRSSLLKCTSLLWQSQPSKRSCCNFAPGPSGFFTAQKHCSLSTASGGTAQGFHAPSALKNKHLLATLQLQPVPVPRSSWSRLRAPALESCANPQSHIPVCHTEKGEPALPD